MTYYWSLYAILTWACLLSYTKVNQNYVIARYITTHHEVRYVTSLVGPKSFIYKPWYGPWWNWRCLTHLSVSKLQRSIRNYETDLEMKKETEFHFISRPGLHQFSVRLGNIFCLHLRKGIWYESETIILSEIFKIICITVCSKPEKINKTHSQFCRICQKSSTPGKKKKA